MKTNYSTSKYFNVLIHHLKPSLVLGCDYITILITVPHTISLYLPVWCTPCLRQEQILPTSAAICRPAAGHWPGISERMRHNSYYSDSYNTWTDWPQVQINAKPADLQQQEQQDNSNNTDKRMPSTTKTNCLNHWCWTNLNHRLNLN